MAMQGMLHEMGVAELIQHFCQEGKIARLSIESGGRQAHVFFDSGHVVHAVRGDIQGEDAVYEILGWSEGRFFLEPEVTSPARTIDRSYAGLLLEGARRLDEVGRASAPVGAPPESPTAHDLATSAPKSMAEIARALTGIEGVKGAVLVAEDGVVLAHSLESADAERDGAVAAFVGAAAVQASQIMKLGEFKRASAKMGAESLVILRHQDYYAGLVLAENASAGMVTSQAEGLLAGTK
jgi:predicted regulator of Ras-like GTPase activity (Roadblock/LC7/MglB family)